MKFELIAHKVFAHHVDMVVKCSRLDYGLHLTGVPILKRGEAIVTVNVGDPRVNGVALIFDTNSEKLIVDTRPKFKFDSTAWPADYIVQVIAPARMGHWEMANVVGIARERYPGWKVMLGDRIV